MRFVAEDHWRVQTPAVTCAVCGWPHELVYRDGVFRCRRPELCGMPVGVRRRSRDDPLASC